MRTELVLKFISGYYYRITIVFNNGLVDTIENVCDYYVNTNNRVLHIVSVNDDYTSWEDDYNIDTIKEVKCSIQTRGVLK